MVAFIDVILCVCVERQSVANAEYERLSFRFDTTWAHVENALSRMPYVFCVLESLVLLSNPHSLCWQIHPHAGIQDTEERTKTSM